MSLFSAIGSLDELSAHLCQTPEAAREVVSLLRHLSRIAAQMDIELDRDFLLREAECWQAQSLSPQARQFIGKRLFAFWRKGMRPVLEQNLTLFPQLLPASVPAELALQLLQFEPMRSEALLAMRMEALAALPAEETGKETTTAAEIQPPVANEQADSIDNTAPAQPHEPMFATPETLPAEVPAPVLEPVPAQDAEREADVVFETPTAPTQPQKQEPVPEPLEPVPEPSAEMEEEIVCSTTPEAGAAFDYAANNAEKAAEIEQAYHKIRDMAVPVLALEDYEDRLLAKLSKNAPQYVVEAIQGIFYLYRTTQEKYPLMCLKNAILQYRKVISAPNTILVCVNYGLEAAQELTYKFSQLSRLTALNEQVYVFLWKNFEVALLQHVQTFRQAVERCKNPEDLCRLLAQYPLVSDTIFKQYPALDVIRQVKTVCDRAVQEPQNAARIIGECWAEGEANLKRHLTWLLVESKVHHKILQAVSGVANVNQLCKALHKLTKEADTQRTAHMLLQLIVTFLKGKQKISFREVQTGVNFVPPFLRERLLLPIKRKLKKDLDQKMQDVLGSKLRMEKRWRKLLDLINNPQLQTPEIQVFGYSLPDMWQKIQKVLDTDGDVNEIIDHIFAGGNIPSSLRELIVARYGYGETHGKKDLHSFLQELEKLNQDVKNGQLLSLRRPLVHLLQSYGQIDFASQGNTLTGYQLSQVVARFYHNPGRTELQLPPQLQQPIAELLLQTVQEEQRRQKRKLEEEKNEHP